MTSLDSFSSRTFDCHLSTNGPGYPVPSTPHHPWSLSNQLLMFQSQYILLIQDLEMPYRITDINYYDITYEILNDVLI